MQIPVPEKKMKFTDSVDFKSKRIQFLLLFLFLGVFLIFLFFLEARLAESLRRFEFDYREFYRRPFHPKLDPFTFIELKKGNPISELEPLDPHFLFSVEEMTLTRFIDYYVWTQSGTDESDRSFDPEKRPLTIAGLGGHLRKRLDYRLEKTELNVDPLLLTDPESLKDSKNEPNKLLWNVIPHCRDPVLEEAFHELGNLNGFLFVRGNHENYRFLRNQDEEVITSIVDAVPAKMAYLHHHNFPNFTKHNLRSPVHVSIICEPIQRKLRHFETDRRQYKDWSYDFSIADDDDQFWWQMNIEECLSSNHTECQYAGLKNIKAATKFDVGRTWLPRRIEWMLPQFCDQDHCQDLGEQSSLDYVKNAINNEYAVVGTLEKMDVTLDLLEKRVPQFFKGIKKIYDEKLKNRLPLLNEPEYKISPETRAEMESRYEQEIQLYRFVTERMINQR